VYERIKNIKKQIEGMEGRGGMGREVRGGE